MRFVFKTDYNADIRLHRHGAQLFWYGLLIIFALSMPFLLDDFFLGEATSILIWSIAGMGLMILTGHAGQASLGHAAFLAVGCYANVILQTRYGLPFLVSFPLAGLIAGFAGVLVSIPFVRLHGIYLAIGTLALSVIIEDIIILAQPITGGVFGLSTPDIHLFGQRINRYASPSLFYWLCLLVTIVVALGYANLLRSSTGRSFLAIRDSEISAKAMGVDVARTKAVAFGLSSMVTGLAGALLGHFAGAFNNESFSILISIQLLLMIVVGGLGSIHGAFFGAFVVSLIPQLINIGRDALVTMTGRGGIAIPGLEVALFGLILIGFLLLEPLGIYGRWLKIRTYLELFPFYRRDMFRRQRGYLKTERMR